MSKVLFQHFMSQVHFKDFCLSYLQEGNKLSVNEIGLQPNENLHERITENGLYTNEIEQYTIEELEEII